VSPEYGVRLIFSPRLVHNSHAQHVSGPRRYMVQCFDTIVVCMLTFIRHSQSCEGFFLGAPGLRVLIPRSAIQAKGLLLAAIRDPTPTIVFEPKILYRAAVEQVPVDDYTLPIDQPEVVREGADLTIVSYGTPLYTCRKLLPTPRSALETDELIRSTRNRAPGKPSPIPSSIPPRAPATAASGAFNPTR
jgi:hypothetical protein